MGHVQWFFVCLPEGNQWIQGYHSFRMFQTKPCGGGNAWGVKVQQTKKRRSYYLTETQFQSNFIDQLVVDPIRYGYSIPQPMVLVYIYLHDRVILDKGKCWDSYSSTMVRIWDCIQSGSIYIYHLFTDGFSIINQPITYVNLWDPLSVSFFE